MYYKVIDKIKKLPADYHQFGYESEYLFYDAIQKLINQYRGKTGTMIEERHDFIRLRFYNIFGGYDDAWLPLFMLTATAIPPKIHPSDAPRKSDVEEMLDNAFGFD